MKKTKFKLKTHRGAHKRFKITASGKVIAKHAGLRHILTKRSSKNKRKKRNPKILNSIEARRVRIMLPYS
ncbi:50S ribosomal protein L35 [Spirochaetota bacterium]|nr:50S ribosomal protein L35 [Spirochaetota bacterium]